MPATVTIRGSLLATLLGEPEAPETRSAASPMATLGRARRAAIVVGVPIAVVFGIVTGVAIGAFTGYASGVGRPVAPAIALGVAVMVTTGPLSDS